MATTFIDYTGDGNATKSFSFPSIQESDVKVEVDTVLKSSGTHYNITNYTTTGGGNVVFTSGNIPSSPAAIRIFRDTDVDSAKATYTAGSSVKAADLNNNHEQLLFAAQEEQNQTVITSRIKDAAVTTAKIAADAITGAKIADNAIGAEHLEGNSVNTGELVNSAVTTDKLAADAVTGAKIADNQINSEHYVDGSIDTAHIGNSQVTTAKIADSNVTTAKIAADAVTGAKIADDQINSEHYVDGSIDTAHIADAQVTTAKIADANVTTAKIAADAVNGTKIADDSINSEHYVDGSIDTAHIGNSQVTTAKIADANITAAKIASNAVTTDKIADGELTTLAGMQSTTASNLASSTALTATTAELNQLDGITLETSITTNSDTRIPTSKAVNDLVLSVTNALGGFVAIANETSFPTTNPDPSNNAGTVVSISQLASGLAVNSSGVATITNGAGTGNTVTITGFPSSLVSQTLPANSGLQVQTTSTLHTYTFHKQLASAADIQAISATVNSFSNRYRVSASAPTSSLDGGDLWYDTTNSKLMVYSSQNSAWEESSAIGNFFISTISSSSNTGGGSATPNGTAYRFTISDAPVSAQQLIVSVDGVIQKPNSGSSQPSEGFVLVGNDIIFGAAPANGASLFVTVIGSTVGIGTPSDNTVTTAILQNGSVTTAKIVDANVTTAKIADDSVTSAKIVSGAITNTKIAQNAVGTLSIAADAIINTLIADNAVQTENIANLAVTEAKLGATSVTASKIAQNAVSLDKLPLGNSTVDGKFLRANNGSAPTFETVNTDLVADTSPQLGGLLETNGHNIKLANANKILLGTTSAYEIYNDSANLIIDQNTDGQVTYIRCKQNGTIQIDASDTGNHVAAKFKFSNDSTPVSSVELYHGNTLRLETRANDVKFHGGLVGIDNAQIQVGNSADLKIYHDGTDSYVDNLVTGNLRIRGNSAGAVELHPKGGQYGVRTIPDGATELYHSGNKKAETVSGGFTVTGTCTATAFAGDGSALTGIQGIPSGVIMIWSGAVNAIPTGFVLCNGQNGTPNLIDRFVVGAGSVYSVGATGGATSASDTVNISISGECSVVSGSNLYITTTNYSIAKRKILFSGSDSDTVTINTLPPYYALCYIMKT